MSDMTPCGEPPLDQPDYYLEPYYEDDAIMLLLGDAAEVSSALDPQSIQAVVTSPPYFGLRDYGVDGQLGAEASPAEFVANLVAVFEAIRPALADDGVMWVVLGDSYSNTTAGWGAGGGSTLVGSKQSRHETPRPRIVDRPAKNLLGIPWRFAFAMQDAGWILRNDIIWAKPNGMPESVTDRLSTKHEHVFLFAKRARYYFDLDAVRQESVTPERHASALSWNRDTKEADVPGQSTKQHRRGRTSYSGAAIGSPQRDPDANGLGLATGGRNPGDVWSVATSPFPGAHFATFPPELPRRCILASTREGDTVLDPFSGSGTTGMVANQSGRKYVGIDLNAEYHDLSLKTRLAQGALL